MAICDFSETLFITTIFQWNCYSWLECPYYTAMTPRMRYLNHFSVSSFEKGLSKSLILIFSPTEKKLTLLKLAPLKRYPRVQYNSSFNFLKSCNSYRGIMVFIFSTDLGKNSLFAITQTLSRPRENRFFFHFQSTVTPLVINIFQI